MTALLKYEWKNGIKSLLIWALSVGGMGLFCILLFQSMEESMAGMAESYASMGTFSEVFGMDTLSIATIRGFFATEVGTIHALGSSMFAASIATVILSKEEDGHTAEFTYTLPVSRVKVIFVKFASVIVNLILFTAICTILYQIGFWVIGDSEMGKDFILFMLAQLLMNVEIASIGFLISSVSKKNKVGIGIAMAMVLYVYDLMARVIPDLENVKFLSPFSYGNAAEIFSNTWDASLALWFGIAITVVLTFLAGLIYNKRDLAS